MFSSPFCPQKSYFCQISVLVTTILQILRLLWTTSGCMMNEKTGQLLNYVIITYDMTPSAKTLLLG